MLAAIKRISKEVPKESATKVLKACLIGKIAYAGFLYLHQQQIRKKLNTIILDAARTIRKKKEDSKNKKCRDTERIKYHPVGGDLSTTNAPRNVKVGKQMDTGFQLYERKNTRFQDELFSSNWDKTEIKRIILKHYGKNMERTWQEHKRRDDFKKN